MGNGVSGLMTDSSSCLFSTCPDGGILGHIDAIFRGGKSLCPRPALCPASAHRAQNPKDKVVKADLFEKSR